MLSVNETPFAAIGFAQKHRDGTEMAVLAVRGQLRLAPDGSLAVTSPGELVLADEYAGDPHATPLLRVGDLIPFKPAADVTVLAEAYAPGDEPAATWPVRVRVDGHEHALRVSGPRLWRPRDTGFALDDAEAVRRAPVDYRFAAGGLVIGDSSGEVDPYNPIGAGILDRRCTATDRSYPAPTLDSEAEPVRDPFSRPEPRGLGPVPPWWRWRQRWAGTYDDAWLAERHPQLPADFDYRFYQTAPPGLILPGYLRGDERVELAGLTPGGGQLGFTLPGIQPWALFQLVSGREVPVLLNLDGLHVDLRGDPPWRVELTWRAWIAAPPCDFAIDLFYASLAENAGLPTCDEQGLSSPEDPT
jgi:hypothetical protein